MIYNIILLSPFILVYFLISSNTYSEPMNNTYSTKNETAIDNNFIIKFSSRGGYAWQDHSIVYNSTNNHLIANHQNYDAIIGEILSQTLTDSELSDKQQQTLGNIIKDGNILNIYFKNEKPECCDIVYYNLVIIVGDRINSIVWTSSNYDNNSIYKQVPPEVTNLVETLQNYTKNSTELYSQSEINDR